MVRTANDKASIIRWPTGEEEVAAVRHQFFQLDGFPGVVGAVDGTHVRIQAPSAHEAAYINRKNYHSINVQIIVSADCKILDVVANWPGGTHDSRILRESTIGRELAAGVHPGLLLGDSGYPCRSWLMTPFLQPRSRAQARYNASHSTTRAVVERYVTIIKVRRLISCYQQHFIWHQCAEIYRTSNSAYITNVTHTPYLCVFICDVCHHCCYVVRTHCCIIIFHLMK